MGMVGVKMMKGILMIIVGIVFMLEMLTTVTMILSMMMNTNIVFWILWSSKRPYLWLYLWLGCLLLPLSWYHRLCMLVVILFLRMYIALLYCLALEK